LNLVRIGAQVLHDLSKFGQRRGTHVRALRKAKKRHDHFALEIVDGAQLPVVISQAQSPTQIGA